MYKVLVCDDEKDIVSAISIYLTSDGYEVIPARNGLEALDIVKQRIRRIRRKYRLPS